MSEPLLIIEDDETIRVTVARFLRRRGLAVVEAATLADARRQIRDGRFGLVLLDIHLPDGNGLDLIPALREATGDCLVIVVTAYPEVGTAVSALKAGAWDYINKPFDLEDLLELLARADETRRLRREVAWRRVQSDTCGLTDPVGESPAFQAMMEVTRRIAAAGQVPVLIRGESGTGKDLVAQTVHCRSPRALGPWIAVNCSALPAGLVESELFGHEKGAFTDARQAKRGLLELADGGALFLDEIGDLPVDLQPKLLRVLETQRFRRVGGSREIQVDVRFVAATHRNLPEMVEAGTFREDLYYRLNVGTIEVPPLRARTGDILPLARHFLGRIAPRLGIPAPDLSSEVPPLLLVYPWPGNIRELRNVLERAAILGGREPIRAAHLPREIQPTTAEAESGSGGSSPAPSSGADGRPATLAEVEAAHIRHVLALAGGNKTRAAEWLGIARLTLRSKLGD